jgi:uncharacterized protein YjbI with pentapeptide repeats
MFNKSERTKFGPNVKPETLKSLIKFVTSYVEEKLINLGLTDTNLQREFVVQCKIACKLATKLIQEKKNHNPPKPEHNYFGRLHNTEAIRLFNILIGKERDKAEASFAAIALDILCTHQNYFFIPERKLSFYGTNYTTHAEKFIQWINDNLAAKNSGSEINVDINLQGKTITKFNVINTTFTKEFNAAQVVFEGGVNFTGCEFKGEVNFKNAKLKVADHDLNNNVFDFSNTKFEHYVDFSQTYFEGLLYGEKTKVNFSGAKFSDGVKFGWFSDTGNKYSASEIDLRGVELKGKKFIQFERELYNCTLRLDRSLLKHVLGLEKVLHRCRGESIFASGEIYIDDRRINCADKLICMLEEAKSSGDH